MKTRHQPTQEYGETLRLQLSVLERRSELSVRMYPLVCGTLLMSNIGQIPGSRRMWSGEQHVRGVFMGLQYDSSSIDAELHLH